MITKKKIFVLLTILMTLTTMSNSLTVKAVDLVDVDPLVFTENNPWLFFNAINIDSSPGSIKAVKL
jgi:hypothetical protein